jgi:hypothetical protein
MHAVGQSGRQDGAAADVVRCVPRQVEQVGRGVGRRNRVQIVSRGTPGSPHVQPQLHDPAPGLGQRDADWTGLAATPEVGVYTGHVPFGRVEVDVQPLPPGRVSHEAPAVAAHAVSG